MGLDRVGKQAGQAVLIDDDRRRCHYFLICDPCICLIWYMGIKGIMILWYCLILILYSTIGSISIISDCFPENLLAHFRGENCPIRNEWVGLYPTLIGRQNQSR